jgi:hypothetical protein
MRSPDMGLSWEPAVRVDEATDHWFFDGVPVATDDRGNWMIVWRDYTVLGARSRDNGKTWEPPAVIATQKLEWPYIRHLNIAGHQNGVWTLAWFAQESRDGPGQTAALGLVAVRSWDGGTTWSRPLLVDSGWLDVPELWDVFYLGSALRPSVVVDPKGEVTLAWASPWNVNPSTGQDLDILFTRLRADRGQ